jgi:hypothetical protein
MIQSESDEVAGAPLYGFDANSMTLYLKSVPINISRGDLLEIVRQTPGFISFSMSEPLKNQDFERLAWVTYNSEDTCRRAKEILESSKV